MFDIKFFMRSDEIKSHIIARDNNLDQSEIIALFEKMRSRAPVVFNVETTNYCNMKCLMCPRTTLMDRKNEWISDDTFIKILNDVVPHNKEVMDEFDLFIHDNYKLLPDIKSEDSFYFYISSRFLTLHGFGEPIIDPKIIDRIHLCSDRKIPTYFSCVPANINVEKVISLMESGLGVIKFSLDSLDDENQKRIRGKMNNFSDAYEKILSILEYKKQNKKLKTKVVVTMIALDDDKESIEMYSDFIELWKDKDVFAYIKSQDNRWYFEETGKIENKSHYNYQYCEFPWTSLSVMANGEVVPCTQDYNTELSFGNVNDRSLDAIWNSNEYKEFRKYHITGDFPDGHKCKERCDIKKIYQYFNDKK